MILTNSEEVKSASPVGVGSRRGDVIEVWNESGAKSSQMTMALSAKALEVGHCVMRKEVYQGGNADESQGFKDWQKEGSPKGRSSHTERTHRADVTSKRKEAGTQQAWPTGWDHDELTGGFIRAGKLDCRAMRRITQSEEVKRDYSLLN